MFAIFNLGLPELIVLGGGVVVLAVGVLVVIFIATRGNSKNKPGDDD